MDSVTGPGIEPLLQTEGRAYLTEVDYHVSAKHGDPSNSEPTLSSATSGPNNSPRMCDGAMLSTSDNGQSASGDSAEDDSEDESSEEDDTEDDDDDDAVLRKAGVKLQLAEMQGLDSAPLTLLTEFVSCCVLNKYKAAKILCSQILILDPGNETAHQFLPVLEERLQLDMDLPTESSSEEEEETDEDSSSSTDTDSSAGDQPAQVTKATPTVSSPSSRHCRRH